MHSTSLTFVSMTALLASTVLLASSLPARAAHNGPRCDPYPNDGIHVCADIFTYVSPREALASGVVEFVPNASRATRCLLTVWVLLHNYYDTVRWKSPVGQNDCTAAMRSGDATIAFADTGSGAAWASAWACVDLYFNHSNHSGWQRCGYSQKVGFTE